MATTKRVEGISFDLDIISLLNEYSKETELKKSTVVNKALREFFDKLEKLPRKKNQN